MKKRYAIVRVGKDGSCVEEFICSGNCNKCDYGDTKEQLIRKIQTQITRYFEGTDKDMKGTLAERIVEFLGVSE